MNISNNTKLDEKYEQEKEKENQINKCSDTYLEDSVFINRNYQTKNKINVKNENRNMVDYYGPSVTTSSRGSTSSSNGSSSTGSGSGLGPLYSMKQMKLELTTIKHNECDSHTTNGLMGVGMGIGIGSNGSCGSGGACGSGYDAVESSNMYKRISTEIMASLQVCKYVDMIVYVVYVILYTIYIILYSFIIYICIEHASYLYGNCSS